MNQDSLRTVIPTNRPAFTISILCVNRLDLVRGCVESILQGHNSCAYELLLTSNGGDEELTEYFNGLAEKHKNIRIIHHETNIGFTGGHTAALWEARGKYLLLLNDDMVIKDPVWLDKILSGFTDTSVKVVGSESCKLTEEMVGCKSSEVFDYVEGSCLAIPTAFARNRGLFDPALEFAYGEDSDLCLSLRRSGYKIARVPIEHDHVREGTTSSVPVDVQGYWEKNHYYLRKKWGAYLRSRSFRENIVIKRRGAHGDVDRKSTRLNSSHTDISRMPSSA